MNILSKSFISLQINFLQTDKKNKNDGKQRTNETVNTIKFSLPVVFPFGRISDIYVDDEGSNH